jgi:riboflavin synthase
MFTGIIEEVGSVKELSAGEKGARITVSCRDIWEGLGIGESVAVNGVCLTVIDKKGGSFTADISEESLERSTLGNMKRGVAVNLERALTLNSRLGGHIVQGHVDGVGRVKAISKVGDGRVYSFSAPSEVEGYLVEKGSIAVDGISLTISSTGNGGFDVAAIPHTVEATNLKSIVMGDGVNLEVDILAKYVRRYMERGLPGWEEAGDTGGSFYEKLIEGGFA